MTTHSLVEVARLYTPQEAQIIRSALESYGIPCTLQNYDQISAQPHLQIALGGIPVMVHNKNAKAARELLSEITSQLPPSAESPLLPKTRKQWWSALATFMMTMLGAPPVKIPYEKSSTDAADKKQ